MHFEKEDITRLATARKYKLIEWQENIKMLSFSNGSTRINIYLTTGTVATCLDHPKHGKTQLFRRKVNRGQLKQIFSNPRQHTGKGYYRSTVTTINHNLKIQKMSTAQNTTKVITGVVRLSFVHVWEPTSMQDGGPKKYSAQLLIPKADKETLKKINAAIAVAMEAGVTSKWGGKKPPVLKMPLRDGDMEKPDDPTYKGMYWISANSAQQPGVLDSDKNEMLDKTKLYSGCFAKVDVNFYAFNSNGSKGVACGLNNILKIKDGPALAGKESAAVAFADVEVPEEEDDL